MKKAWVKNEYLLIIQKVKRALFLHKALNKKTIYHSFTQSQSSALFYCLYAALLQDS